MTALLRVTYVLAIPEDVTEAQAGEWLRFHLALGSLPAGHPLEDKDVADLLLPNGLSYQLHNARMEWAA